MEREHFSPESLGYPSGHAAVAWGITIIVLFCLGGHWRIAAIVLAIVVPIVRMYVAAHLLLDLIGGAAIGVLVASAVALAARRPEILGCKRSLGLRGPGHRPARGDRRGIRRLVEE